MDGSNSTDFQWIFVFIIVAVAWFAIYYKQSKYPLSYVKSNVDNEQYLVRNLPDKQEAADRLARTREKLVRLRKHLEQTHKSTPFVANICSLLSCFGDVKNAFGKLCPCIFRSEEPEPPLIHEEKENLILW